MKLAIPEVDNDTPRWRYVWIEDGIVNDQFPPVWAWGTYGIVPRLPANSAAYARNLLEQWNAVGYGYGHQLAAGRMIPGTNLVFSHVPNDTRVEMQVSADVATLEERFTFVAPNPILGQC